MSFEMNLCTSPQETMSTGRDGFWTEDGLEPMTAVQRACETGVAVITNPSRATGWMVLPETFCLLSCDRPMVKYPEGTLTMSKVTSETV